MSYILETSNLTKIYNGVRVVDGVNMHIEEGDIYGFVGENGAGKTTIIRLITGLAEPNEGTYSLYGVDYKNPAIAEQRKNVGAIVEKVSLNGSFSALENLRSQRYLLGTKKTDEELINLLGKVGLDYSAIKGKKTNNFSLGMRQRLGIALAMVSDSKFILLDEPMNGLDPQGFIELREIILELNKSGITFLISSHILAELDKICTRVGFISHGKLVKEVAMNQIKNTSTRKIIIDVEDAVKAKAVLDSVFSSSDIRVENNSVVIYGDIDINKVAKTLVLNDIIFKGINTKDETIEDVYIDVVANGGNK